MSKIEKMLQCNDCVEKLNKLCEDLGYNDAEREVAAEVILWLEMGKLKKSKISQTFYTSAPITPSWPDLDESYTKC